MFAIVTGLLMALIFRKDDAARTTGQIHAPDAGDTGRSLLQETLYIMTMVLILVFAAFARPADDTAGLWATIYSVRWYIIAALPIALGFMLKAWFTREEGKDWVGATWGFMKQISPCWPVACWQTVGMRVVQ